MEDKICEIIDVARSWLGVRFHHQGRDKQAGVDCLGLLIVIANTCELAFRNVLLAAQDETDYGHNPDPDYLRAKLESVLMLIDNKNARAGDIALFSIDGRAQHLALLADYPCADELSMIHAYAPARKVIEHRLDAHWRKQMVAVFRMHESVSR